MNKKVVFSGLVMLVLLASCGKEEITSNTGDLVSQVVQETSTPADTSIAEVVDEPVFLGQGFAEYDESLIGETENTVLFFHQESCGTCKTTEADLIANGTNPDLQVLKIDIDADSSTELKKKYGVTMKHTFVQIDADGEMIKKMEWINVRRGYSGTSFWGSYDEG